MDQKQKRLSFCDLIRTASLALAARAKKHPQINVDYRSHGANWTLSVIDNGVGMPINASAKPGLGSSIVQALAMQLDASVAVADAKPGTAVSIAHTKISAVRHATAIATPRAV
jgi:two-component sensor histidine kinase